MIVVVIVSSLNFSTCFGFHEADRPQIPSKSLTLSSDQTSTLDDGEPRYVGGDDFRSNHNERSDQYSTYQKSVGIREADCYYTYSIPRRSTGSYNSDSKQYDEALSV